MDPSGDDLCEWVFTVGKTQFSQSVLESRCHGANHFIVQGGALQNPIDRQFRGFRTPPLLAGPSRPAFSFGGGPTVTPRGPATNPPAGWLRQRSRFSNNGQEARQPYELRQRPMASPLATAEQQDWAREARLAIVLEEPEASPVDGVQREWAA
jgi:hypothetical protein